MADFTGRFCGLLHAPGRILGTSTQTFRAAGVLLILPTHTFRVAVTVAFYLHKLFGLPSPSQLHFSYTNFSGGRGFAFFTCTRFRGDSYANLRNMLSIFENLCLALLLVDCTPTCEWLAAPTDEGDASDHS